MDSMSVTLDVSKLSGWLNAVASCRVETRAHTMRGAEVQTAEAGGQASCGTGGGSADATGLHCLEGRLGFRGEVCSKECGVVPGRGWGRPAAHPEHVVHICDAGGVPAGYVRVEILHVVEEPFHIGDARDVPVGDGAVRRNGGGRISVVVLDRKPQGDPAREGAGRRGRQGPAKTGTAR